MKKLITPIKAILLSIALSLSTNIFAEENESEDVEITYQTSGDNERVFNSIRCSWEDINKTIEKIIEEPTEKLEIKLLKDTIIHNPLTLNNNVYVDLFLNKKKIVADNCAAIVIEEANPTLNIYPGDDKQIIEDSGAGFYAEGDAILINYESCGLNIYGGVYKSTGGYAINSSNNRELTVKLYAGKFSGKDVAVNNIVIESNSWGNGNPAYYYDYEGNKKYSVEARIDNNNQYYCKYIKGYSQDGSPNYGGDANSFTVEPLKANLILAKYYKYYKNDDDEEEEVVSPTEYGRLLLGDTIKFHLYRGDKELNYCTADTVYESNLKYSEIEGNENAEVINGEIIKVVFKANDGYCFYYDNYVIGDEIIYNYVVEINNEVVEVEGQNNFYDIGGWLALDGYNVIERENYEVGSKTDLNNALAEIAEQSDNGDVNKKTVATIKLTSDIDMQNSTLEYAGENFYAQIKGNGYTLENVALDQNKAILPLSEGSEVSEICIKINANADTEANSGEVSEYGEEPKYINIFGDYFDGSLKGVGIVVENVTATNLSSDATVNFALANQIGDNAKMLQSFVYFGDGEYQQTDGNKVCVVLKQNMVVGKGKGRTYKVCQGPKGSNNSLTINSDPTTGADYEEINKEVRECTAEQFANGEVAYWLNYDGQGYTGEYNKLWSQGDEYPVLSSSRSASIVKLLYVIEGSASVADVNATINFAKIGDEVDLAYTRQPDKITIDGEVATLGIDKTTFIVPETEEGKGIVTVKIYYPATAIAQTKSSVLNISVKNNNIVVDNVANQKVELFDMNGHCLISQVAQGENITIVIPTSGIYVVKVGNETKKVRIEY